MLALNFAGGRVDQFQQQELGEGFGAMRFGSIPSPRLRRGGVIVALPAAIAFGVQVKINRVIKDGQMAQAECFTLRVKLGRWVPTFARRLPKSLKFVRNAPGLLRTHLSATA